MADTLSNASDILLRLSLLGGATAEDGGGVALVSPGRKGIALLAYLALSPGHRASRDKLADLLWPDRETVQARNNLRQVLSVIKKALPDGQDEVFDAGRDFVGLRAGTFSCDVTEVLAACEPVHSGDDVRVLGGYAGPFLDGFHCGSDAFDSWAAMTRERIGLTVSQAIQERIRKADPEVAVNLLRKALEIDPTREDTYRFGMELFTVRRQREQALRLYDTCKAMLAREFGVGPSIETELVKERIIAGLPTDAIGGEIQPESHVAPSHRRRVVVHVNRLENASGEKEHDLFLRALSDSLAVELSQIHDIDVVSRDAPADRIGARPAGLALTGSLISFGSQIQMVVRLSEEPSGRSLSVERFRFEGGEHIALIDEIAECIALSTKFECLHSRWRMRDLTPVDPFPARLLVLKSHCRYYELTEASLTEAIELAERALGLCPTSLRARRMLSLAMTGAMVQGALRPDPETVAKAVGLAQEVAQAVPEDVFTRCVLAWALGQDGRHEAAMEQLRFALRRNPEYSTLHSDLAVHLVLVGYTNEALAEVEEAIRLSGEDVVSFWRYFAAALAQYAAGNFAAAVESTRRALRDKPGLRRGLVLHAAAASALGLVDEARQAVRHLLSERPGLTQRNVMPEVMPQFAQEALNVRFRAHLAAAGLPD